MQDDTRFANFSWETTRRLGFAVLAIVGTASFLLVTLAFQPGWANGWPMGISKHVVFSVFVTTMLILIISSCCAVLVAIVSYLVQETTNRQFTGWSTFLVAIVLLCLSISFATPRVFAAIHASIKSEWQ